MPSFPRVIGGAESNVACGLAAPPDRGTTDRPAALDDATWGTLRLGAGWTRADWAPEEVRTP